MSIFAPRFFPIATTPGIEEEREENGGSEERGTTTRADAITDGILDEISGLVASSTSVRVSDQAAGGHVVVYDAHLSQDGWIVIHEVVNGHVANALGAALRNAGEYEQVEVQLLRGTEAGRAYVVVLYADNGNRQFDIRADQPLLDAVGDPIIQSFSATTPADVE
jgi:hypothetical protein